MTISQPRFGYTLPVFACAAAVAALQHLRDDNKSSLSVKIDLITPPEIAEIAIEQVASITENSALAITRSDPGDNLDLTRNTPIWALVEFRQDGEETIIIKGGEGIGRLEKQRGQAAIYRYGRKLLEVNLQKLLLAGEKITVTIIMPEGRKLADRTSNAAFGVVEGLSLLGTTGISEPLSAPGQLEIFREELRQKQEYFDSLVFCIGENGLDFAKKLGINPSRLLKTGNWLGPLMVEAAILGVKSIILFGYHGKLIKLAGGIFHTHHYLADARLEIFTAYCADRGLSTEDLQAILKSTTAEAGLQYLRELDNIKGSNYLQEVYNTIARQIDQRSMAYIHTHSEKNIRVGSILFDRQRQIIVKSEIGADLLTFLSIN